MENFLVLAGLWYVATKLSDMTNGTNEPISYTEAYTNPQYIDSYAANDGIR
jgi:hypothetical protein